MIAFSKTASEMCCSVVYSPKYLNLKQSIPRIAIDQFDKIWALLGFGVDYFDRTLAEQVL